MNANETVQTEDRLPDNPIEGAYARRHLSEHSLDKNEVHGETSGRLEVGEFSIDGHVSLFVDIGAKNHEWVEVYMTPSSFKRIAEMMAVADRETAISAFASAILKTDARKRRRTSKGG